MKKLLFISVFLILLSSSESCLAVKWPLPRVELRSLDNAMRVTWHRLYIRMLLQQPDSSVRQYMIMIPWQIYM